MLSDIPASTDDRVLIDFRTADDAGVYRWEGGPALVQTVDFFTPIVDDPYSYGQIAAANAVSDVYAMGGRPLCAMNIMAIPPEKKEALVRRLAAGLDAVGAFKVENFITTDGYKFLLPKGEWVAFRVSGTEPVVRCYIEARSAANLSKLRKACRELLKS